MLNYLQLLKKNCGKFNRLPCSVLFISVYEGKFT
jgi:hypothetical protein